MFKILIIDDDEDILDLIEMATNGLAAKIFKAYDGKKGWDTFIEERPDVVITDYKMPGLDGYELAQLIRKESPHCLIILLTGTENLEEKVRSQFSHIAPKPFSIVDFQKTLKTLSGNK